MNKKIIKIKIRSVYKMGQSIKDIVELNFLGVLS